MATQSGADKNLSVKLRGTLGYLFKLAGRVVHYGFVPAILYLGIKRGQTDPNLPPITLRNIIWLM